MQVMVPAEACDLTIAQIMESTTILPPERLRALWERRAELKRRETIMQVHTTEGRGSPLTALRAELREAEDALFACGTAVVNYLEQRSTEKA
jgi:hypothetical protein